MFSTNPFADANLYVDGIWHRNDGINSHQSANYYRLNWYALVLSGTLTFANANQIKTTQHNTLIGGWTSMDKYRLNKLTKRKRELRANERDDRPVFVSHSLNIGIKLFQWHRS